MFTKALALVLLLAVAASAEFTARFEDHYDEDLSVTEPAAAIVTQPRVQP